MPLDRNLVYFSLKLQSPDNWSIISGAIWIFISSGLRRPEEAYREKTYSIVHRKPVPLVSVSNFIIQRKGSFRCIWQEWCKLSSHILVWFSQNYSRKKKRHCKLSERFPVHKICSQPTIMGHEKLAENHRPSSIILFHNGSCEDSVRSLAQYGEYLCSGHWSRCWCVHIAQSGRSVKYMLYKFESSSSHWSMEDSEACKLQLLCSSNSVRLVSRLDCWHQ